MSQLTIGIVLFDGVELLDFAGPLEVFSAAAELSANSPFRLLTVALDSVNITTAHGLNVEADCSRHDAPDFHWLLIPGGSGIRQVMKTPSQMNWLIDRGEQAQKLISVCTGALALGAAGFLQGVRATTHQQFLDELAVVAPACEVVEGQRYVVDGRILTAAGVSAGLDLALHLVALQLGEELASRVSSYVEYPPQR